MADQLSFLIGTSINAFSPEDATIKWALSQHLPSVPQYYKVYTTSVPLDQKYYISHIVDTHTRTHTHTHNPPQQLPFLSLLHASQMQYGFQARATVANTHPLPFPKLIN